MFKKILIANRGEIACRIINTARKLGIKTVAVYSDVDSNAQHVAMADEAIHIGPSTPIKSYLSADNIIKAALDSGATAIHPGYGFLSENYQFAALCAEKNITFIGPSVSAIRAMGSKSAAKDIMAKAGVPLVPGYHGDKQSFKDLLQAAKTIGFPVLLKPTAGGGGKGMRIVTTEEDFSEALDSCKREARTSFADDEVLIEKYLPQARHVEIQIFADNHGNTVHLFDRDCSVQRRHQKIIEEAPAPNISDEVRAIMRNVAIKAAEAINYSGAGTVEFLYEQDGSFYFMEMNTRLQVEHPITEMISGIDLVEWQLLIANNHPLPLQQNQIMCNGHAFEARIYAEDPRRDFLPITGKIVHLSTPTEATDIRIDTGICLGDQVSIYYDPMIAKLIVWGENRSSALQKLQQALADYQIVGITTNLEFLSAIATNQNFIDALVDTSFIGKQQQNLLPEPKAVTNECLAIATLYLLTKQSILTAFQASQSADPYSPWNQLNGWSNTTSNPQKFEFFDDSYTESSIESDSELRTVSVTYQHNNYLINIGDECFYATATINEHRVTASLSGQIIESSIIEHEHKLHIKTQGKEVVLSLIQPASANHDLTHSQLASSLNAPMPGTVVSIKINVGDSIEQNQTLMIIEAMKMEHTISAPYSGVVDKINYKIGELVTEGAALVVIDPDN